MSLEQKVKERIPNEKGLGVARTILSCLRSAHTKKQFLKWRETPAGPTPSLLHLPPPPPTRLAPCQGREGTGECHIKKNHFQVMLSNICCSVCMQYGAAIIPQSIFSFSQ
ncbi:hypothetical protein CDAR_525061 [Caerostris darwini]|uniref:Uncharacterized protein n=1 Tax=Caerostris darwini TaxID=1538125 RepID=A0AAV4QV39_9ARAC|nr:hypothetical protein CDAR_525061 [Caerostris darwini]